MPLPPFTNTMGATGGAGAGSGFSLVTSSNSALSTIAIPALSQAGDVVVLADFCGNTDGAALPASVTPTGFTSVKTTSAIIGSTGYRCNASYKKLVPGDPGSTITGMTDNVKAKVCMVFRPAFSIVSVTASTWNGELTAGNPSSQTVSGTAGAAPLIVFGIAAVAGTVVMFTTQSPGFDGAAGISDGSTYSMIMGYKIYNTSPQDHSLDKADEGAANALLSGYLQFA